uniref:E-selectin-like n=1 Tax=Ciona intestinalis TaxID=7719 RepID=UPI000EF542F1|nr:E-selectin-like [Ciona intestinalis]|eukprot:XP_026693431.1 E-selectin-like [Ciona intestinalis]
MNWLFYLISVLLAARATGTLCFVCDTAKSNEHCTRIGRIRRCASDQMCQNEARTTDRGVRIWKRCKQKLACENNYRQNVQCNPSELGSICRCCCNTDRCNLKLLYCHEKIIEQFPERILLCPPLEPPDNGSVICPNKNNVSYIGVGTTCTFDCDPGYDVIGPSSSRCTKLPHQNVARFDKEPPMCLKHECAIQHTELEGGNVSCNDSNMIGSICRFVCEAGYVLSGSNLLTCEPNRFWSTVAPTCQLIVCPAHIDSANGLAECTDENRPGSQCRFLCNQGYALSNNSTLNCSFTNETNAEWDKPAPICEEILCTELGQINNGQFSCSNSNHFNSTCSLECNADQDYFPSPRNTEFVCIDGVWDAPRPCCTRNCPPYTKMDLVLVLDSSSSVGKENWKSMMGFAETVINSFVVGSNLTRVSVIRYNGKVDNATQILFNDFLDDQEGLLNKLRTLPYRGSGTKTGQALRYAKRELLKESNGNRKEVTDVVVVITDGRSHDKVAGPSRALRNDGALIYVIGVEPDNGNVLDEEHLIDVSGSATRVIRVTSGFSGLTNTFQADLTEHICGNLCSDGDSITGKFLERFSTSRKTY